MKLSGQFLSGVCGTVAVGLASASARAQGKASSERLNEIFKSMQPSAQRSDIAVPWTPILLGIVAVALMGFAVKHWKRRKAAPVATALNNHRKLLREAARSAGVSQRQLKRIAPLAHANGLCSPLVAIICPSAIKKLSASVRTSEQQAALRSIAQRLVQRETRD